MRLELRPQRFSCPTEQLIKHFILQACTQFQKNKMKPYMFLTLKEFELKLKMIVTDESSGRYSVYNANNPSGSSGRYAAGQNANSTGRANGHYNTNQNASGAGGTNGRYNTGQNANSVGRGNGRFVGQNSVHHGEPVGNFQKVRYMGQGYPEGLPIRDGESNSVEGLQGNDQA